MKFLPYVLKNIFQALVVDPLYLQHSYSESAIDYRKHNKQIIRTRRLALPLKAF